MKHWSFLGRAAPPGAELPTASPPSPSPQRSRSVGMGGCRVGSKTGPLSLQWVLAMSSPLRSVFLRGSFVGFTEPGSCRAPGAAARRAAPPRGTCCLFTSAPSDLVVASISAEGRASHPFLTSKAVDPPLFPPSGRRACPNFWPC